MTAPPRFTSSGCTICSSRRAAARLPDKERRFEAGLLDLRRASGPLFRNPHGVEISGGVLYRAVITIPSQVPVGTYTAETFLIDRRKVIAAATRDIQIDKSGFERFVALAARRHGFVLRSGRGAPLARRWAGPPLPLSGAASRPKINILSQF